MQGRQPRLSEGEGQTTYPSTRLRHRCRPCGKPKGRYPVVGAALGVHEASSTGALKRRLAGRKRVDGDSKLGANSKLCSLTCASLIERLKSGLKAPNISASLHLLRTYYPALLRWRQLDRVCSNRSKLEFCSNKQRIRGRLYVFLTQYHTLLNFSEGGVCDFAGRPHLGWSWLSCSSCSQPRSGPTGRIT